MGGGAEGQEWGAALALAQQKENFSSVVISVAYRSLKEAGRIYYGLALLRAYQPKRNPPGASTSTFIEIAYGGRELWPRNTEHVGHSPMH